MNQDETWHACRPTPWPHCVRWGPSSSKQEQPPIFGLHLLCRNVWMNQDAIWYGGRPRAKQYCVRWGPSAPSTKREQKPQFSAHVYCGQTGGWIKMPLGMEVCLGPGHIVLDGDPAPPHQRGTAPIFSPYLL